MATMATPAESVKPAVAGASPPRTAPAPAMRRNDVSMTDMSDMDAGDNLYHVRKSRLIRLINWWQVRCRRAGGGSLFELALVLGIVGYRYCENTTTSYR